MEQRNGEVVSTTGSERVKKLCLMSHYSSVALVLWLDLESVILEIERSSRADIKHLNGEREYAIVIKRLQTASWAMTVSRILTVWWLESYEKQNHSSHTDYKSQN